MQFVIAVLLFLINLKEFQEQRVSSDPETSSRGELEILGPQKQSGGLY
jgi:hypothetical protein